MEKYVTDCPFKTPPMSVTIKRNPGGQITKIYDVPAGFQLDRYVGDLHPNCVLLMDYPKEGVFRCFRVKVLDGDKLVETHIGVYQESPNNMFTL